MTGGDPGEGVGLLHSLILGVVEGLTEFLPVSSTGHLIVVNRLLGRIDPTMEIGIQIGAISAILVLYRARLLDSVRHFHVPGRVNLLVLLAVAALPAVVLGLLFNQRLEEAWMTPMVVGFTTLLGGLLLLLLEGFLARRTARGQPPLLGIEQITVRQALVIGLFQSLALIPGTSRSGATIAGGLLLGLSRAAAAEFSFLVGLPILYGACLLKLWKVRATLHDQVLLDLLVGALAAFLTAALVVGPFVRYLQRHTFVPFAIYRVLAGIAMLVWFANG